MNNEETKDTQRGGEASLLWLLVTVALHIFLLL